MVVGKEMQLEEAAKCKDKICGIYSITNKLDCKVYVGQSKSVYDRAASHAKCNTNVHLKNAIAKYGIENFVHKVEMFCEEEELAANEAAIFCKYKNADTVMYNIAECGSGGNTLKFATEERKGEISAKHKATLASRTAEEIAEINAKIKATLANRTAEEVAERNARIKAALANRTAEEVAERNARIKAALANRTAEEVAERNAKHKAALANRTAEEVAETSAKKSATNTAKFCNVVEDTIKVCLQNRLFTFCKYKKYCTTNNLELQVSKSYFCKIIFFATHKEQLTEFVCIYKPNMDYNTYSSLCKLKPIPVTNYAVTVKYSTYKHFI